MTIAYLAANKITGTSSDTKPTTVPTNSIFIETDTRIRYLFNGTTWQAFSGGVGSWSGDDAANMSGVGSRAHATASLAMKMDADFTASPTTSFTNKMDADVTCSATASFLDTIT